MSHKADFSNFQNGKKTNNFLIGKSLGLSQDSKRAIRVLIVKIKKISRFINNKLLFHQQHPLFLYIEDCFTD